MTAKDNLIHAVDKPYFLKVARRGLGIPVFDSLLQLQQLCKGFTNEQIAVAMTSKFVAMATSYEVKDTLIFTV